MLKLHVQSPIAYHLTVFSSTELQLTDNDSIYSLICKVRTVFTNIKGCIYIALSLLLCRYTCVYVYVATFESREKRSECSSVCVRSVVCEEWSV